jgi:hypothetical protein
VPQDVGRQRPNVFRHHIGSVPQEGMRPGRLGQGDRGPGRAAEGYQRLEVAKTNQSGITGSADQVDDVVDHFLVHIQIGDLRPG